MYTLLLSLYSLLIISSDSNNDHKLTLKDTNLPNPIEVVEIVNVFDARGDKDNIGWVQTGLFNKKRTARFENPFVEEVLDFLMRENKPDQEAIPVVIKINSFYISEQTLAMSETAKAEVAFSIYHQIEDNSYKFIQKVYGTSELRAMDVTHKHPENIATAFVEAFSQLRIDEYEEQKAQTITSLDLLNESPSVVNNAEILTASEYKEGVFETFSDFAGNSPSIVDKYEIKGKKNLKLILFDDNGKKTREKDVYGMMYEGQLYIMFHQHFYPLEKRGNNFYFIGPKIADSGAVAAGAVLGGAIGGAIASSATARSYEYKVDMTSGRLIELGEVKKRD